MIERAALHRLLMPPHPGGVYLSSALCSCGEWQYDGDSQNDLFAEYASILRSHTQHIAAPMHAYEPHTKEVLNGDV